MSLVDLEAQGYAVVRGAVPPEIVAQVLCETERMKKNNAKIVSKNANAQGYLYRVVNLHLALNGMRLAFASSTKALDICDSFFAPAQCFTRRFISSAARSSLFIVIPHIFSRTPRGNTWVFGWHLKM